jgi:hypothetical protein
MRGLAGLLAVALMCALPGRTLAESHRLSGYGQGSFSCGMHVHYDNAEAYPQLHCVAGVAIKVSWSGMKVRSTQGSTLRIRFTDATVFETDSGQGVLDGLVSGDYVCVAYAIRAGTMSALLVVFDPNSIPCSSRQRCEQFDPTHGAANSDIDHNQHGTMTTSWSRSHPPAQAAGSP